MSKIKVELNVPDGDNCVNNEQSRECRYLHFLPLCCAMFNKQIFRIVEIDTNVYPKCKECKDAEVRENKPDLCYLTIKCPACNRTDCWTDNNDGTCQCKCGEEIEVKK